MRRLLGADEASPELRGLLPELLRRLASLGPLEHAELRRLPGWGTDLWRQLEDWGAEIDGRGRIVGLAGLSVPWTPHRVDMATAGFYAWCALDTLVLPWILGGDATVRSVCPSTGTPVVLDVSLDGAVTSEPPAARLSVVVPGHGLDRGVCLRRSLVGRRGFFCSRVWFFADGEAGARWLEEAEDAWLVTPEEGLELARSLWGEPVKPSCRTGPGSHPGAR